jgi:hypothetical protein
MNGSKKTDLQPVTLLESVLERCTTVLAALKMRKTSRTIGNRPVPLQVLSDILWAAQGVNRVQGPFGDQGKTAGSASISQEICVYVAMKEGTYLYETALIG